jgi:AraC family transcriptional regulator, regulatory protein of adaptative response / DNA-3-methyladenine glycosylase II
VISSQLHLHPKLQQRVEALPGLRVPGCWDPFELAVRAVLGQQVTVKGATTLAARLVRAFGKPVLTTQGLTHLFPSPEVIANSDLQTIGLPRARASCLRNLAQAVRDQELSFRGVADTEQFKARFCELPGIGSWTANYVAMRALAEPDAFPASDLGLLHAAGLRSPRELEELSQSWRPWRAYAAMYLWQVPAAKALSLMERARPEQSISRLSPTA